MAGTLRAAAAYPGRVPGARTLGAYDGRMKFAAKAAIVTAIVAAPLEWVNFRYFAFPIDVGYENPAWWQQVTGVEWVLLHLPGLWALLWLDKTGHPALGAVAVVAGGYLDTFLLLFVLVLLVHWMGQLMRRRTPEPV